MSRRGPAQVSGSLRQKGVPGTAPSELQELQSRTECAERRLLACENLVGELGSGLAALGTVLQSYGQLQQRLLNLENLLKNRNFWILRLPPSSKGEIPKVPLTFDDISVYFNELEWERLERWQKDLYRAVMRGNYETLVSLDYAVSKPDILSWMERDEELGDKEGQEPPWTRSGHGQEPPRAAGEMDKADEAPGDENPVEAGPESPILMMTVTSLGDHQPGVVAEEEPDMEEDPAEPDTEEASPMEDETPCKGVSPEDIKVKEEEPELLAEESTPSPGSEIQKCPKNELVKAKSKKKPNRCEASNLLMGNCRRGYVREWSHPCTECGKRFRLKINLIIHQRSHAKEGPYECPVCEIGFSNKRHLDLHRSIHVKDRAFGAKVWGNVHPELRIRPRRDLCGGTHGPPGAGHAGGPWLGQPKEEPDREGLSASGFTRPPDSRLKCPYCKKFLSCSVSLRRHLQTHLRERPYCCSSCNKCFTRSNHLVRHKKIHERALAALQREANAQPPAAIPASLQHRAPEANRSPSQGNGSPEAAKPSLPNVLLLGATSLEHQGKGSSLPECIRKAVQPVVQLGSRAVASEMTLGQI
ncbi:zinc finger protein 777-like isoform X4 [Catharus ustulatus]|uniref:zinc finger protein 777-like isoform X4 n=1 Tax=Catharus ustulatus TaxID=91951 RepID=UPI00140E10AC|nr:zinc finger protein 777-like isoform X4 [Catharus ustulatus]